MIFIVGPHCVGKTTVANYLSDRGFIHIETGDIVRQKHQELAPEMNFYNWASENNNRFDHYIASYVEKALFQVYKSNGKLSDVVITGNRQIEGVNYLTENVKEVCKRPNLVIFMEAEEKTLYERHLQRLCRETRSITFNLFKKEVLGYDKTMGLEKLRGIANLVICNNTDIKECTKKIDEFLESNGYNLHSRNIEGNIGRIESK